MYKNTINSKFRKKLNYILIFTSVLSLVLLVDSNFLFNFQRYSYDHDDKSGEDHFYKNNLKNANENSILFEGIEQSLIINDTGLLYDLNQEISVSNQEETNLSYYLDDIHNWKASKIQTSISNIQDTRDWVNNSDFYELDSPYRVNQSFQNIDPPGFPSHNYSSDLDNDPTNPSNIHSTITESGASAMRLHFSTIEIETDWDLLFIYDENNVLQFTFNGMATDFYTPWITSDTLKITINSDDLIEWYGYEIDYYEYYNTSTNYFDYSSSWGANNGSLTRNIGPGEIDNNTAMYLTLLSNPYRDGDMVATYYEDDFSEIYQNITIPRGSVVDGYISFDYYAEEVMDSNENFIYCEINNKKVYSKGLGDVVDLGRQTWHNTGRIYINLWTNTTEIFNDIENNNEFNVSVGIMSGSSVSYSGYDDRFQQIFWFDNISMVLSTLANSTQNDINLTINGQNFLDGNQWGNSYRNLTSNWDTDPVSLSLNTNSPLLEFELDTILFGFHETTSKIEQTTQEGISYKILENGSVFWEFSHNFYMPAEYSEFEFTILKPLNWEFTSVLDPTLDSISFEGGNLGDQTLKINKNNAKFPGWWTFTATSPNYIEESNTQMFKQGQWDQSSFITGETTKIRTQINNSDEIPPNLALTMANLTIYDPDGLIWYEESINPLSNGTVFFSDITFTALNSIGGQYNYTIFWSNGTAVGGTKSEFIVNHQSSIMLLKPNDALPDLMTEGFVGDFIYLQVLLKDSENNITISNSLISYNWTDGTRFFSELGLGIYETLIDTGDLLTRGLYNIIIKSIKTGFFESNITFKINLGEETNLQVLESEEEIELHANSTIKFKFTNYAETGIEGALVNISISNNSLYSIDDEGGGVYSIEFSTLFINTIGTYELSINFSAVSYEPQYYKYQFDIIKQSVNLSVIINSLEISEDSLVETEFNEQLNISVRAISNIDGEYNLTGSVITCKSISGNYQKNLSLYPNFWYNTSILCSPENFSLGINAIYFEFNNPNYKTATFGLKLSIDQIDINVDPIGFEDTINAEIGQTINIELQLLDPNTYDLIEDAIITYSWGYGIGTINQTIPGTYEVSVKLPEGLQGNFRFDVIITPNSSIYKSTQYSFIVVIGEPIIGGNNFPSLLLWIIIGVLVSVASVLGVLSLRSYVILPRKRKKEAELLSKTQRFKDLKNIQAIVVVHKMSGIPIYSKSYSILEKHKKELFSGFIQAITTVGEEFSEEDSNVQDSKDSPSFYGSEKILELDFKYFYCLIADKEDVRVVFVLKNKSSERLKSQVSNLILALNLKISRELENWDGSLDIFEATIPSIINEYFELYYKGSFRLSAKIDLLTLRKERSFSKLEIRVLNVIQSVSKRNNNIVNLDNIIELVSEENKDLIIEAIEVLIERKMITPINP